MNIMIKLKIEKEEIYEHNQRNSQNRIKRYVRGRMHYKKLEVYGTSFHSNQY